jgi:hypothetical protein
VPDSDPLDSRPSVPDRPGEGSDAPTVACSRCGDAWTLAYELDELQVGNRAVERFALDHRRHTGHFPDDVTPWVADCLRCPDRDQFLSETPARRFARTHARHTRHAVELRSPDGGSERVTESERDRSDGGTGGSE